MVKEDLIEVEGVIIEALINGSNTNSIFSLDGKFAGLSISICSPFDIVISGKYSIRMIKHTHILIDCKASAPQTIPEF